MSGYAYAALAGLQLAGGYFASQNMRESAKINQEIADMNAEFAELDAYDAVAEGYTQQAKYQAVIDQTLGEQQLIQTAQDVDVNYGTAATVQAETRFTAELNLMEIQKQAQEKALGYKTQARGIRSNAVLQRADTEAKAAGVMFNSVLGAAQTGLSGYRKAGAPSVGGDESVSNGNPFR